MMLIGESQRIRRQTCLSANLFTTNPTWIGLGLNRSVRATDRQNHVLASKDLSLAKAIAWLSAVLEFDWNAEERRFG